MERPAIAIEGLDFCYGSDLPLALRGVNLTVEQGERCLVVGANGAGKTTLLRLIAGKHMIPDRALRVLGRPAFSDTSLAAEVAFLGGAFPFEVDVQVGDMLAGLGGDPQRQRRLVQILEVDLSWRMHRISDGQRRRVQLLMGLLHPFAVLLLDEITTDLDLLGRADLLRFLRQESEQRGTCILYATHIFDRLEAWSTHLVFLHRGRLLLKRPVDQIDQLRKMRQRGVLHPLSRMLEGWMRDA
jgi:CCR4-NOT complex subunit CAF16